MIRYTRVNTSVCLSSVALRCVEHGALRAAKTANATGWYSRGKSTWGYMTSSGPSKGVRGKGGEERGISVASRNLRRVGRSSSWT